MLGGGQEGRTPSVSYMSHSQKARYLEDLRSNKLARPSGSRPPPPSKFGSLRRSGTEANVTPALRSEELRASTSMPMIAAGQNTTHKRNESNGSSRSPFAGRSLVRPPSTQPSEKDERSSVEEQPMQRKPSLKYMVRGTRWMEQQETKSLRRALEDMDIEKEKTIHSAAQDEATELVWKHQNPDAPHANPHTPYSNPDTKRKDYHSHLRKGSYTREHDQEGVPVLAARRDASSGSHKGSVSVDMSTMGSKRKSGEVLRKISPPTAIISNKKTRTPSGKSYGGLAESVADDIVNAHRRISSGGGKRMMSGEKKMFMHKNDRIWEDPQEGQPQLTPKANKTIVDPPKISPPPQPPQQQQQPPPANLARKNPFARVRMQAEKLERTNSEPIIGGQARHNNVEIQRNPPSQSRNPWYMSNEPLPPTPPSSAGPSPDEVSPKVTPTGDSKEIRGDDIRAATSKQRKDYSPKLPRPTMVSDKPGRPIVSFKQDWRPKEVVLEEMKTPSIPRGGSEPPASSHSRGSSREIPQTSVNRGSMPPIPTINVPDDPAVPSAVLPEEPDFAGPAIAGSTPMLTPSINVDPPSINVQPPAINVNGPERAPSRSNRTPQPPAINVRGQERPSSRSNRTPQPPARHLPHHAATSLFPKSRPHYTPSVRQSGPQCAQCALPIAGRVLSAAGQRFHPECFVCHQCDTNLELVAFYPEPETKRCERLDRIAARQAGLPTTDPEEDNMTPEQLLEQEVQDGDSGLRFYCHLDFHELFSPRCKSCKTPIEGEVIVACGAEWHQGHFFCAQCGDPFDSTMPFVEKDGYAWCVNCHTNRYSSKCRKCKKPVTETVVKALGWDWHGECFVCMECNGEFEDGRYFLRGESQDPVCVKCEERRLKA